MDMQRVVSDYVYRDGDLSFLIVKLLKVAEISGQGKLVLENKGKHPIAKVSTVVFPKYVKSLEKYESSLIVSPTIEVISTNNEDWTSSHTDFLYFIVRCKALMKWDSPPIDVIAAFLEDLFDCAIGMNLFTNVQRYDFTNACCFLHRVLTMLNTADKRHKTLHNKLDIAYRHMDKSLYVNGDFTIISRIFSKKFISNGPRYKSKKLQESKTRPLQESKKRALEMTLRSQKHAVEKTNGRRIIFSHDGLEYYYDDSVTENRIVEDEINIVYNFATKTFQEIKHGMSRAIKFNRDSILPHTDVVGEEEIRKIGTAEKMYSTAPVVIWNVFQRLTNLYHNTWDWSKPYFVIRLPDTWNKIEKLNASKSSNEFKEKLFELMTELVELKIGNAKLLVYPYEIAVIGWINGFEQRVLPMDGRYYVLDFLKEWQIKYYNGELCTNNNINTFGWFNRQVVKSLMTPITTTALANTTDIIDTATVKDSDENANSTAKRDANTVAEPIPNENETKKTMEKDNSSVPFKRLKYNYLLKRWLVSDPVISTLQPNALEMNTEDIL